MRRRLKIKKRLQRQRSNLLRTTAKHAAGASKSGVNNFGLISAGLTHSFMS